jgi:hypothetical protein
MIVLLAGRHLKWGRQHPVVVNTSKEELFKNSISQINKIS